MLKNNKEIIWNIIWLVLEKLFAVVMVFVAEGMIARSLSIEDYGKWLYSVNLVLLLSSLSLVVPAQISVPAFVRYKKLTQSILLHTFIIRMIVSLFLFGVVFLYAIFFVQDAVLREFIFILSIVLLFNEPFGVISNYFQAKIFIRPVAMIRLLGLFTRMFIILIFVKSFHYQLFIPLSRVIETIVVASLLLFLLFSHKLILSLKFYKKVFQALFYKGLRLWPALTLMYLFQRLDRFFVEHYLSFDFLSQYGVSVQIMEQGFLLVAIIIQSLAPKYIYKKQNAKLQTKSIKTLLLLMGFISLCLFIGGFFLLPFLIQFVYGKLYDLAGKIVLYMLPALLFFAIDELFMQYFYRDNLSAVVFKKYFILAIVSSLSYFFFLGFLKWQTPEIVFLLNYFVMVCYSAVMYLRNYYYENKN